MRPPVRYYLTTAAALLAILLCGYGIGFLVGERVTQERLGPGGGDGPRPESWEEATLERLSDELALSADQRELVRKEIEASSLRIGEARRTAAGVYRNELLDLHGRLLPHLEEGQRKQVEESSRSLKKLLDEREEEEDADGSEEQS